MGDVQVRQGIMRSVRCVHTLWEIPRFAQSHSELLLALWFRTLKSWWLRWYVALPHQRKILTPSISRWIKTSATFVYLITIRSFTFNLLNTQRHDNWNIWHVVFHNTVVYLWNIPSVVAIWQRKQYACVAPKASDLEGQTGTAVNWRIGRLSGALRSRRIGALSYEKC